MKKIVLTLSALAITASAFAQNSAIFKAKALEEKGEIEQAISVLEEAINNPKTTKLAEVYNQAAELTAKEFNPELMRAASSQPFDTVKFGNLLDKMVSYYTLSHEADVKPDEKGRVKAKLVAQNHKRILDMLDYYNYAAVFMNQNKQAAKSMEYFEKYLAMPKNPVFTAAETDSIYKSKAQYYNQTAFNLALLNFNEKNWDKAIGYADDALANSDSKRDLYIIKMQSLLGKNDSAAYLKTLTEAVTSTEDEGFMQNLLYHYVSKNDLAGASAMADELTSNNAQSKAAWYMKGCVALNMKKDYAAARECFEKSLAIDPDYVEANTNMAYTYMNEVIANKVDGKYKFIGSSKTITGQANVNQYKKELAEVKSFYEKALPYMEKVRAAQPDQPKSWAYSLQMIYQNLQMKDKEIEIDEIIKGL